MLIQAMDIQGKSNSLSINTFPDLCPVCNKGCTPNLVYAFINPRPFSDLQVVYRCPNRDCYSLFIGFYKVTSSPLSSSSICRLFLTKVINPISKRPFSENIYILSPSFCEIYWEAEIAEENKLLSICGVGYRKALEFLIKDYIIKHVLIEKPEEHEKVLNNLLGKCISLYIDDPRIKDTSERAVWLGNDETHYTRRWENKDLSDLKKLINMTVNWIELVLDYDEYITEMPK